MYYTYILLCSNGEYYKGCTNNIEDRLLRHQRGYVESTKELLPVKLTTYTAFTDQLSEWFRSCVFKEAFGLTLCLR